MKNTTLELIRGVAAILVVFTHLFSNNETLNHVPFHTLISGWGTESVILFFVLSGIVINLTHTKKPKGRTEFFKNRLLRIYPLYFIGLILACVVTPVFINQSINFKTAFLNFFF